MYGFMTMGEYSLVMQDYEMMLLSPEATPTWFNIIRKLGGRKNDVYNHTEAFSVSEFSVSTPSLQQIVKPVDDEVLAWGILQAGDCIFYVSNNFNPGWQDTDEVYITTPDGLKWVPVPKTMDGFYKFIRARLGSSQVGQCVPAKLKRSN